MLNVSNAIIINKPFTRFLISRALITSGIKMAPALLGWYIYELTDSAVALGMLGLCEVVPAIILALPAGVAVDRSSRAAIILKCFVAYLGIMIAFFILTLDSVKLHLSNVAITYIIYFLVALTGWARAYYSPASSAMLSQMVEQTDLIRAATSYSMSWLVAAILGPLAGGLLIGFFSIKIAFAVCILLVISAFLLFRTIVPLSEFVPKQIDRTWLGVKEGLDFVFSNKPLLGAMSLDMFAVLFGGAVALLPVFAKDILHVGPQGYGLLASATYLGNFLALLYFYKKPIEKEQGRKLIWSVGAFGVCILIFAISRNLWISFIALLASGLFDGVSMVVRSTIFQILVPENMRGRVSSVSSIFINSSNELGQFESGLASKLMGTVPSVIFGGSMTVLIALYTYFKVPALKKLEY